MRGNVTIKFKIGSLIEFESVGNILDVEILRKEFINSIFPSVVELIKIETIKNTEKIILEENNNN